MTSERGRDGVGRGQTAWTVWRVFIDHDDRGGVAAWLQAFRLRAFRLVVSITIAGLLLLVVRTAWVGGPFPWADLANAVFFVGVLFVTRLRPQWLRPLTWLGLASFFVNAIDGVMPYLGQPVAPAFVLMPLLVLYGALLGDVWMSGVAATGVLVIYGISAARHWPLGRTDTIVLTNLCCTTILTGLAAFGVWVQHLRFAEAFRLQAGSLRRELDARLRLNAIVFHDIRNPLCALMAATALAKRKPRPERADLEIVDQMAERIGSVIESAREMGTDFEVELSGVAVRMLREDLEEVFAPRLAAKGQTLALLGGADLAVKTQRQVLCHSVLGNILGNAIKFAPRGSTIGLAASAEGGSVRIEVRDQGRGFPATVLSHGARGASCGSKPGTEGEVGSAYGLRIAALCLRRLGGTLEVRNCEGGGASVAVVLPRANGGPVPES